MKFSNATIFSASVLLLAGGLLFTQIAQAAPVPSAAHTICSLNGKLSIRNSCPRGYKKINNISDLYQPSLAPNSTLRGFYSSANFSDYSVSHPDPGGIIYGTISFIFSLKSAPTAHYIAYNEDPPAQCPGDVNHPEASPGHLCVYEDGRSPSVEAVTVATTAGENTEATFGAIISVRANAPGAAQVHGTWAVTAPLARAIISR